jgi:hypothetical protein
MDEPKPNPKEPDPMDALKTQTQTLIRCTNPGGCMTLLQERLSELGTIPHVDPLSTWEESLSMQDLTDDLVDEIREGSTQPGNLIPNCIDAAASAIRLAHVLARAQRQLDAKSGTISTGN